MMGGWEAGKSEELCLRVGHVTCIIMLMRYARGACPCFMHNHVAAGLQAAGRAVSISYTQARRPVSRQRGSPRVGPAAVRHRGRLALVNC